MLCSHSRCNVHHLLHSKSATVQLAELALKQQAAERTRTVAAVTLARLSLLNKYKVTDVIAAQCRCLLTDSKQVNVALQLVYDPAVCCIFLPLHESTTASSSHRRSDIVVHVNRSSTLCIWHCSSCCRTTPKSDQHSCTACWRRRRLMAGSTRRRSGAHVL
jgi:hypothetical protein